MRAVAVGLSIALLCRPASADETPSLAAEPVPAGDPGFLVERAGVRGDLLVPARLVIDYARRPLVLSTLDREIDEVVVDQLWMHALASLWIAHRLAIGVDVPFVARQTPGVPPASPTAPRSPNGAAFGDLRLGGRVVVWGSAEAGAGEDDLGTEIALSASFWLPTATGGYSGDGVFRVRGALVASGADERFYWAANLGARSRTVEMLASHLPTRVGTSLVAGLAGGFFLDRHRNVSLGLEATADLTLDGGARFLDPRASVFHLLATGHGRIPGLPIEVGAGFGPDLAEGVGAADYHLTLMLGYAPRTPSPPPDEDEDGIADRTDACLDLPGPASDDPALNGCPEPPSDRDGDSIPDDHDACPLAAGVATGVRRTHGCPVKRDRDGDGIEDDQDDCPDKPGVADHGGCPPPRADIVAERIEISQQVTFETDTANLLPESDVILSKVASILIDHPEITLVEVAGHTDDTGTAEHNEELSQARAESVVAWLVTRGIEASRLRARGYGAREPIADNESEAGRAQNRRVELRILEREAAP